MYASVFEMTAMGVGSTKTKPTLVETLKNNLRLSFNAYIKDIEATEVAAAASLFGKIPQALSLSGVEGKAKACGFLESIQYITEFDVLMGQIFAVKWGLGSKCIINKAICAVMCPPGDKDFKLIHYHSEKALGALYGSSLLIRHASKDEDIIAIWKQQMKYDIQMQAELESRIDFSS